MNRQDDRFARDSGRVQPSESATFLPFEAMTEAESDATSRPECGAGRASHPCTSSSSSSTTPNEPHADTVHEHLEEPPEPQIDESLGERIIRFAHVAATMHLGAKAQSMLDAAADSASVSANSEFHDLGGAA